MTPLRIPIVPPGPRFRLRVPLSGVVVVLRFDWRGSRPATARGWWCAVELADAPELGTIWAARVSPGAPLWPLSLRALYPGLPDGEVVATGPDPYAEADLGDDLALTYLPGGIAALRELVDG